MSSNLTKFVAGAAIAGAVAFGGLSLASAQDDGTTTTEDPSVTAEDPGTTTETPAPEADGAQPDGERPHREGCPEKDGEASNGDDATTEGSSFSTT